MPAPQANYRRLISFTTSFLVLCRLHKPTIVSYINDFSTQSAIFGAEID